MAFLRSKKRRNGAYSMTGSAHTPKLPGLLRASAMSLAIFLVGLVLIMLGLSWLSGVSIIPFAKGSVSPSALYDLVRTTVSAGTLIGGTFAVVYAYRKQRIDEAASHRADAEQFSKRYYDAATQLGHERATVRLAGIYAVGRLADTWLEGRQICVELLCAYLRMPYTSTNETDDEQVVRATILSVIRNHVSDPESPTSWCDMDFDFSGGTFDEVQLNGGCFRGSVSFTDAKFTGIQRWDDARNRGWINFDECIFEGGVSFFQARFHECIASFDGAQFRMGTVHFGGASFRNFNLFFRKAKFAGAEVYFGGTEFDCERAGENLGSIWFNEAEFESSKITFRGVTLRGSTEMQFDRVVLRAGKLDLSGIDLPQGNVNDLPRVVVRPTLAAQGVLKLPSPNSSRIQLQEAVDPPRS